MRAKFILASGAALLLAFGMSAAEARPHGGGGGGGFHGGGGFKGGGGSFGSGGMRGNPGRSFSGPRSYSGPRNFNRAPGNFNRGAKGNWRPVRPGPGQNYGRPGHNHGHHHHHHRRHRYVGVPYFYDYGYYDGYYGGDDCGWLYRRAVSTNSPYWWNRYRACTY